MKKQLLAIFAIQAAIVILNGPAVAQMITPAATEAEKEAFYATAIENRVGDILKALNLADAGKSNTVHDILVTQYHELRVRDAAIDTRLKVEGKEVNYENRAAQLAAQSKPLHDQFIAKLAAMLTSEQVEKIKDLMTYNKVKVTFDAYCAIMPDLTDPEKGKILELLQQAREEAVDGGNAPEKSAIFQKYKNQIRDYLIKNGRDVDKAFKDWTDRNPNTNNPVAK